MTETEASARAGRTSCRRPANSNTPSSSQPRMVWAERAPGPSSIHPTRRQRAWGYRSFTLRQASAYSATPLASISRDTSVHRAAAECPAGEGGPQARDNGGHPGDSGAPGGYGPVNHGLDGVADNHVGRELPEKVGQLDQQAAVVKGIESLAGHGNVPVLRAQLRYLGVHVGGVSGGAGGHPVACCDQVADQGSAEGAYHLSGASQYYYVCGLCQCRLLALSPGVGLGVGGQYSG